MVIMQAGASSAEETFRSYLDALCAECCSAMRHLQILEDLWNLWPKYTNAMLCAPGFWHVTTDAHERSFTSSLMLLTIGDTKSVTMRTLLEFARKHPELFANPAYEWQSKYSQKAQSRLSEDIRELKGMRNLIRRIENWRNKLYFHLDRKYVENSYDVIRKEPIRHSEARQLVYWIAERLEIYGIAFDGSEHGIRGKFGYEGLEVVLESFALGLEVQRQSEADRAD